EPIGPLPLRSAPGGGAETNSPRRGFLRRAGGAAALPALSLTARAQAYPSGRVRLIVGYAPAGGTDITARLIGQWLSERLGQQFIIENRRGAGRNIATGAGVRGLPGGYTLPVGPSADAFNAALSDKLHFTFIRAIAPVAGIIIVPDVMVVHPSVPAKTIPELIAYAKANPGKINIASGTIGGPAHVAAELFKMMTGTDMPLVSYRSGGSLTDLLGGQVQVMFATMPSSIGNVRAGKLRALAVPAAPRSDALPDLPTVAEFVQGYEFSFWTGIGAPRTTPAEIVDKLNKEINTGAWRPHVQDAPCRRGGFGVIGLARRLRQADRGGNREVG